MLTTELREGTLFLKLSGELDHSWAKAIRERLDTAIESSRFNRAVFDFEGLTFMDSTGVGLLLGRYKRLKELGREMVVTNVNNQIDKVLKVSGIYKIIAKI